MCSPLDWFNGHSHSLSVRLLRLAEDASLYRGFVLGDNDMPCAVTVCGPHHLVTYAHGDHVNWQLDQPVEVRNSIGTV